MAGQRAVKGLDEGPLVPLGAVAFHGGQHLPELVAASHGIEELPQRPQHKVLPAGLHGGDLRPLVPARVVAAGGANGARPARGVLHLPAGHEQEVAQDGHAVVAPPGRHGRQLAPVGRTGDVHVVLPLGGVEEAQLPHAAHLALAPARDVQGQGAEAGLGARRLPDRLGEDGAVVVQGPPR